MSLVTDEVASRVDCLHFITFYLSWGDVAKIFEFIQQFWQNLEELFLSMRSDVRLSHDPYHHQNVGSPPFVAEPFPRLKSVACIVRNYRHLIDFLSTIESAPLVTLSIDMMRETDTYPSAFQSKWLERFFPALRSIIFQGGGPETNCV